MSDEKLALSDATYCTKLQSGARSEPRQRRLT